MISRPTLIWLIVAVFLIGSGVGVYFAIRRSAAPPGPTGAPIKLDKPPPVTRNDASALQVSENGKVQLVDKNDPNRQAGEIQYKRLDPLPKGRYSLVEPQLWLFGKDGRTLHLRAAKGDVKFFPGGNDKLESGKFEGGVIARMYGVGVATPAVRPDPAVTPPELLAYTDAIAFDLSVGEFSTAEVVNLSTEEMELQGEGMTLMYNEVRERVDGIRFTAQGYLHVRPKGKGARATASGAPKAPAPEKSAADAPVTSAATSTTPPLKEEMYEADITGPIVLTVGTKSPQSITSDRLLAWARLVDGKIPPGGIAELGGGTKQVNATVGAGDEAGPASRATPAAGPEARSTAQQAPAQPGVRERIEKLRIAGPEGLAPLTPIGEEDSLLTWSGQMVVNAQDARPAELEKEEVAVRFVSDGKEPVTLRDMRSGTTVRCDAVHYGATTARAELIPKTAEMVVLTDAHGGRATLPGLTLDLKGGVGVSRGVGELVREDPKKKDASGQAEKQTLTWQDQADFTFASDASGATLDAIRWASLAGSVRGQSGETRVEGDVLQAWFGKTKATDALLERVLVEGNAAGSTTSETEPQGLRARRLELTFKPDEKGTEPVATWMMATGDVDARRTELVGGGTEGAEKKPRVSTLTCDALEADLGKDAKGNTLVTSAAARGKARFVRSDGMHAEGEEITADVGAKTAEVTGASASVAGNGATLTGTDLHLDQGRDGVAAKGPGELRHVDTDAAKKVRSGAEAALPPEQIGVTTLSWTKGMVYDGAKGEGEARGGVVAVTSPDPYTLRTVKGEQVTVKTARRVKEEKGEKPRAEENVLGDVRLLREEVIGSESGGAGAARATVEQRRYVRDENAPNGRRLESLVYVEGPRLIADDEHETFNVPAPGKALVMDRSAAPAEGEEKEKAAPATTPLGSASLKGTTLMEWSGAMTMDRVKEAADVTGGVRITHKPLKESDKPRVIEADAVQAEFRLVKKEKEPAETDKPGEEYQLTKATAQGGVRITMDGRDKEMTADEAVYDAVTKIVEASAGPGNRVSFTDKTRGATTIAKKLRWNTQTDEIVIVEQMPIVGPVK